MSNRRADRSGGDGDAPESESLSDAVRLLIRRFAEDRLAPVVDALETGEQSPVPLMRELATTFGLDALAATAVEALERRGDTARTRDGEPPVSSGSDSDADSDADADADSDADVDAPSMDDPAILATVMTELTRVNPGFALSFGASLGLCGQTILKQGTAEQRRRFALPVLGFEKIGAWALTEPEAGSDAFAMRTTARPVGDGWELNGEKTFITNAPLADVFVVHARLEGVGDGLDGRIHGFIVERGMPGLSTSRPFSKMGMRSSPTGSIHLDGVQVGRERLLGGSEEGGGKRGVLQTLFGERVALGAMALGIIERSLEIALAYAKERRQFGKPIAEFQAVQLTLARMYAAQETVRALLEKNVRLVREGRADIAFLCAAKYTASTLATEVAMDAVQVLGGAGYMTEHRVEMLARDAKLLEIGGGTSDIQLLTVARELLRR